MGERKVLNKYYPVDFDPSKLPRNKRPADQQELVRFMLPMTVRCSNCGEYMYAGKKFNSKKEKAKGEDYLGIAIYRFYMKCVTCASQFSIKTDPKNADYACESGVTRNFEPWRASAQSAEELDAMKNDEADLDAMQALEKKTMTAKEEMDALDELEDLKSANAKMAQIDINKLLQSYAKFESDYDPDIVNEQDLEEARRAFDAKRSKLSRIADTEERERDQDQDQSQMQVQKQLHQAVNQNGNQVDGPNIIPSTLVSHEKKQARAGLFATSKLKIQVKKKDSKENHDGIDAGPTGNKIQANALSALATYSSSSSASAE